MQNNNNKFYIIQILQNENKSDECYLFMRWGRVGVKGQTSNIQSTLLGAIAQYRAKYH